MLHFQHLLLLVVATTIGLAVNSHALASQVDVTNIDVDKTEIDIANNRSIAYDGRSFILDGERVMLLGGAVHYTRVLPEDWSGVFDNLVKLGLNSVQTYVMWNFHEHVRGELTWSGRANMTQFIRLAQEKGACVPITTRIVACLFCSCAASHLDFSRQDSHS